MRCCYALRPFSFSCSCSRFLFFLIKAAVFLTTWFCQSLFFFLRAHYFYLLFVIVRTRFCFGVAKFCTELVFVYNVSSLVRVTSAPPFSRHSLPQMMNSVLTFCGDLCTCTLVKAFFCLLCSLRCERACFQSLSRFRVTAMPFGTAAATRVATYAYLMALKPSQEGCCICG